MRKTDMKKEVEEYITKIDNEIKAGKYKDNWKSLSEYRIPEWYKNAKFGIFIHWGVYSVPAFGEWYPRYMYIKGTETNKFHIKNFGDPKDFGYKDFIPMFKAEKFDPQKWMELIKESGARYIVPVAEHHDGFQMYNSNLSEWCAAKMGPHRDIINELKTSAEKNGIIFGVSDHRAENYWFYAGASTFDSGIHGEGIVEPYGVRDKAYSTNDMDTGVNSKPASKEFMDDWLARVCEVVDKYEPRMMWFDWWTQNKCFKPYLKKFAAYYYNRAKECGFEPVINYKNEAFAYTTAVYDIERGQLTDISPTYWQTDTAIGMDSWGYSYKNHYKKATDIVCDLIDIVSKNGAMLLNIGPKSDGTISSEETEVLKSIGKWMKINGESIYGTRYWHIFGEGPTKIREGAFTDTAREKYTSKDIRFTYNCPYVYANVLNWPENGLIKIKSLGRKAFQGELKSIKILGYDNAVNWVQNDDDVEITVLGNISTDFPVCLKIELL
jgi:alpha-L-fucosidase